MEAAILRTVVNPPPLGANIERRRIDDRGNPTSTGITTRVGQPPPGAEGPGERGENQVRGGYYSRIVLVLW
jgi:hypothetical protein